MSMKIAKIMLENFKQFVGRQELELSTDGKRNITLIQGNNAYGKTNLMAAVGWCFYGHSIIRDVCCKHEDIVSNQLKKKSNERKRFVTSVEVTLIYQGKKYRVKREITYKMMKRSPAQVHSAFTLHLVKPDGEKPLPSIPTLDSIIPQDVAAHFFLAWTRTMLFGLSLNEPYVKVAMTSMLGNGYARKIPNFAKKCSRLFKAIVGKDDRHSSLTVRLYGKHGFQLQNKAGKNVIDTLASEPRAALGLAFLLTLIKLSKFKFPVIMDNPFLWFTNYQRNVAASLKGLQRQVILLATDAELYNMRSILKDWVGKHHVLSPNKKNAATVVTLKN